MLKKKCRFLCSFGVQLKILFCILIVRGAISAQYPMDVRVQWLEELQNRGLYKMMVWGRRPIMELKFSRRKALDRICYKLAHRGRVLLRWCSAPGTVRGTAPEGLGVPASGALTATLVRRLFDKVT